MDLGFHSFEPRLRISISVNENKKIPLLFKFKAEG